MEPNEYTFIFVLGMIFAFMDAFGIGANDVANSFATSVSSKSLTLKQAYFIATFMEFGGAVLFGSGVADTIKKKIINVSLFSEQPELLMLGFLCALISSSIWVIGAARLGWPVSTTHSIVGAVVGIGVSAFGWGAVDWGWKGMGSIIASWFISPAVAGVVATLFYLPTKYFVLRKPDSFRRGLLAVPIYFIVAITIGVLYLMLKGGKKVKLDAENIGIVLGASLGAGFVVGFLSYVFAVPWYRRKLDGEDMKWYQVFYTPFVPTQPQNPNLQQELDQFMDHGAEMYRLKSAESGGSTDTIVTENIQIDDTLSGSNLVVPNNNTTTQTITIEVKEKPEGKKNRFLAKATQGLNKDVAKVQSKHVAKVHDQAEKYDPKTEYLYTFVQVVTASFASFAHGSNDVANAVGPLAAIFAIWSTGTFSTKTEVPLWVLAYGGAGLVVGFVTMGYFVMRSLGNNLTFHSPARGFSMELGAALTVLSASYIGLPVSTTHCITGATAAVGVANGTAKALNWRMMGWCLFSWILTVPVTATMSGALFGFVARSPHI